MIRADLRPGRLLAVWAPLAATFLLLTGATPVVNASINRLPGRDHTADLAAFAIVIQILIALRSPLFVAREIAIKLSVDRAGSRRALRFCLGVAGVIAAVELVAGATPLGAWAVGLFTDDPAMADAHRAFLFTWPAPFLVAVRGVYQAHQIRVDDTLFVGFGTLVRLMLTAAVGLLLAPQLDIAGATLGAICVTLGIAAETVFAVWRARQSARPPPTTGVPGKSALAFGLPLMVANSLGIAAGLFYLAIAGMVPDSAQEASLAGYQEVRSIHWLLTSGAFALQSLTTAKVRAPEDVKPMLGFAAIVGAGLSALFALIAFTPLRERVLVDLMNERPDGDVLRFATPALGVAVAMPLLNALRFGLRGVLISRGQSAGIALSSGVSLVVLTGVLVFSLGPTVANGVLNVYVIWVTLLLLEVCFLAALLLRAHGRLAPVQTGGRGTGVRHAGGE